jgi:2-polyprenyl-3-methyl-5-hydroxy-6-metoxy-1,4-benzoquinol methylase
MSGVVSPALSTDSARAVHFDGGNYFDDMRVDIASSHERLDRLLRSPTSVARSRLRNVAALYLTALAIRLRVHELLIISGVRRRWLDEFHRYWSEILGGRPFWNTVDFFLLTHEYRKRQQYVRALAWNGPAQHVAHWQQPGELYATFHHVRKAATRPIVARPFWKRVRPGMRILEYGCSLAPFYHCYREFYSHLRCRWLLADLPNYPFHFARYLYRNDADVDFRVIAAERFSDPLAGAGEFDAIVATTVLEHVDDPVFVAEYLLDRLKPGGLLVFDYIRSEAVGLDHPRALADREACLRRILARVRVVHGNVTDLTASVGLCIAEKRRLETPPS